MKQQKCYVNAEGSIVNTKRPLSFFFLSLNGERKGSEYVMNVWNWKINRSREDF
jgi:hypothetical protein